MDEKTILNEAKSIIKSAEEPIADSIGGKISAITRRAIYYNMDRAMSILSDLVAADEEPEGVDTIDESFQLVRIAFGLFDRALDTEISGKDRSDIVLLLELATRGINTVLEDLEAA